MYYSHFGLTQPPFRITPDTEFFYSGGNRGPILEALMYAIGQGEGIIKVTGEVGSGKTMLCTMLQSRLPGNVETVYISNPSVAPEEILHAIALELQLKLPADIGHLELMQALHRYLLDRHAQHKQVVMFVEESQSMPIATLEEIRLLSNLETAHSKLLQIVLFGQPELEENLREPHIRQLRERITHSFRLSPLKHDEIRDYLNFRLRAAGYRGPELFSPGVIKAIAKASGGLTRRINLVADKALLAAFSENTHTVKQQHVKAAVRDSAFSHYEPPQPRLKMRFAWLLFGIGAGVGIALSALVFYQRAEAPTSERSAAVAGSQSKLPAPVPPANLPPPAIPSGTPQSASTPQPAQELTSPDPAAAPASVGASPVPAPDSSPDVASQEKTEPPTIRPIKLAASSEVSANSQSVSSNLDPLEARLATTRNWLMQQDKTTYSIQLLGTDNAQQLKNHLNVITKFVEINDIFVYRTLAKQKPSLTVLYGSFSDRRAAQQALAKLPPSLKAFRPILRTVQGVRDEIAQHPSS